jgi:hypothetical protein
LTRNPSIKIKDIIENPDINWDMVAFSANPSLRIADVEAHPELEWNYATLSGNRMNA